MFYYDYFNGNVVSSISRIKKKEEKFDFVEIKEGDNGPAILIISDWSFFIAQR